MPLFSCVVPLPLRAVGRRLRFIHSESSPFPQVTFKWVYWEGGFVAFSHFALFAPLPKLHSFTCIYAFGVGFKKVNT